MIVQETNLLELNEGIQLKQNKKVEHEQEMICEVLKQQVWHF